MRERAYPGFLNMGTSTKIVYFPYFHYPQARQHICEFNLCTLSVTMYITDATFHIRFIRAAH